MFLVDDLDYTILVINEASKANSVSPTRLLTIKQSDLGVYCLHEVKLDLLLRAEISRQNVHLPFQLTVKVF